MVARSNRRRARRLALEALYEWDAVGHDAQAALERRAEDGGVQLTSETYGFAQRLVATVIRDSGRLDSLIKSKATAWPFDQIAVVDRNIMRLALSEVLTHDTPRGAAVSEAVELAKSFGGDASGRFVNGVLANLLDSPSKTDAGGAQ